MILGRGTARTDEAIIAEYHRLLDDDANRRSVTRLAWLRAAPRLMVDRIGKPIVKWTDEDILSLYNNRSPTTRQRISSFVAFLVFRGYYLPTMRFLASFPPKITLYHRHALAPYRQMLIQAQNELCYTRSECGSELILLVWLLAMARKSLEALTRDDFEVFRDQYQAWYRANKSPKGNPRLYRLDRYLVHLGIIPEAKIVRSHEEYFAQLHHESIRQAISAYVRWCNVRYKPGTTVRHRLGLLRFFLWFQERHPDCSHLDHVTRKTALEYAQHLRTKVESRIYHASTCNNLYAVLRQFFDFAIEEGLDTVPGRNPFSRRDMPPRPDSVPRYIPDHELRMVLEYCEDGASLRERTVITILLHTGIRAAELAALQVHDVVQIQGKWKLHIREGKGLKDRIIPLTPQCLDALHTWQRDGWEGISDYLFTLHGRRWKQGKRVSEIIREVRHKLNLKKLSPHCFRHTFAVALLNYGLRESALQKLLGHKGMAMTLQYGRILDHTVEQAFNQAVEQMETGPLKWVPSFFKAEDYTLFTEDDALNWIRLPHGYCRRHHKLHCESDVKCLLCDRFRALRTDLPRLREMHNRFLELGMETKADVVSSHIRHLEAQIGDLPILETTGLQHLECYDEPCFSNDLVLSLTG
jgi:site-specific recombinase XerD